MLLVVCGPQGFVAQPRLAIQELKSQMEAESDQRSRVSREILVLEQALQRKAEARIQVLAQVGEGLFRRDEIKMVLQRIADGAADTRSAWLNSARYPPIPRLGFSPWTGREGCAETCGQR
jgi:hypothetical protein